MDFASLPLVAKCALYLIGLAMWAYWSFDSGRRVWLLAPLLRVPGINMIRTKVGGCPLILHLLINISASALCAYCAFRSLNALAHDAMSFA